MLEHYDGAVATPHRTGELKMQSKNDTTETKTEKRAKKTRTNKDSALLHFMFIRDEITSLPRPRQGNRNKKLDDDQVIEYVYPEGKSRLDLNKIINNFFKS